MDFFAPQTSYFGARRPSMLIIHGTECDNPMSQKILSGQTEHQASAHYYIDDQGNITQYLDETIRAWHAGQGYWAGITDLNSISVGIELMGVSISRKFDDTKYTDAQMAALSQLAKEIIDRQGIMPWHVLGHQDVSCTRDFEPKPLSETQESPFGLQKKYDPGTSFDWRKLAKNGVGLWHDLSPAENDPVVTDTTVIRYFKNNLALYGYDLRVASAPHFSSVVRAFQTHYLPWHICGEVTEESVRALDILLQKKLD